MSQVCQQQIPIVINKSLIYSIFLFFQIDFLHQFIKMKTRGQFSKPAPFNYQSHQSLQKFRKVPVQQRAEDAVQDIFKIKIKGQQNSKLIAARNSTPSKQEEVKQLKKQIKLIEGELKKKIMDNPLLSRIFKTKQMTPGELSHLDLYLEFIKLKEEQQNTEKKFQESLESYKQKEIQYELQISKIKEEKELGEQSFITQIEKATEKFEMLQRQFQKKLAQKQKLFQKETIERQSKIEDHNLIMEELKRKNHKLIKDNKELDSKLSECKKNQQQRIKSLKSEFQSYKKKSEEERTQSRDQIQTLKQNLKQSEQNLSISVQSLQNELAEKTLQIQELDRFIELQKESFESQIYQLETSYQRKLFEEREEYQEQMMKAKGKTEGQFINSMKEAEDKLKQVTSKYENELKRIKQESRRDKSQINQLQVLIQQKIGDIRRVQDEAKKYKIETDTEIQTLKSSVMLISDQKQSLSKKLIQFENKVDMMSKENQLLKHQKNQIHSRYEKGFVNTQQNMRHQQGVIEELQRKIYMLGNQNIGLKKSLQQKTNVQSKAKEYSRVSEETYQQKYKAIGRIEQIRHKLENYLSSDFTRGCFSGSLLNSTSKYRSNNSTSTASLTESIQGLTLVLDKICQSYSSLNQMIEVFRKQKLEDEREIESILNHFVDMEERQEELQEGLINYINVRKELTKQATAGGINYGQEYLQEKKRQICQFLIEKLIQLKVIKQYSSADHGVASYRMSNQLQITQRRNQQENDFRSSTSSSNFMSSKNTRNSRKSLKKLLQQENYRSNNNQFSVQQIEELGMTDKGSHMRDSLQPDRRGSILYKTKQPIKNKNTPISKYNHRLSTQPIRNEDVNEEQLTYEVVDENIDYVNLRAGKGYSSKSKIPQQYNSGNQTADKQQLNKKYKQEIKEKLLTGKTKRQSNFPLSKQEIQKKYFLR